MLSLNNVNVLENQTKPTKSRDIADWPLLDSRGNSLDDFGPRPQKSIAPPEKNSLRWREKTPETDDERDVVPVLPPSDDEFSDEDDLDGEEDEMQAAISNRMGNAERNYMYPEHDPRKANPAKPPMLKFKASLFSRNVLVVNRALKKFMNKDQQEVDQNEDEEGLHVLLFLLLLQSSFYLVSRTICQFFFASIMFKTNIGLCVHYIVA